METSDYERLKTRQRAEREGYPPNLGLRVHRALSWLSRAEQLAASDDTDGQFVFLWIAFNAAYATEIDERHRLSEQETFRTFLEKLVTLDAKQGRIEGLVWREFPGSIRLLLDNPYVFQDFWNFQNGTLPEAQWKANFERAKKSAAAALGRRDTVAVLSVVLSRIYTLRNQLIHGGATWGSSVNREQLRDCTRFMAKLVPLLIEIMMDHRDTLWGDACYPVVK
ncbi:MAG TPA: hypothetical protein VMT50_11830 [Steroidobacteraceae bacterium]|nr:hypothetical protein [Steroidobacteraceae bacterium]